MSSISELKKDFQPLIKKDKLGHGYILFGHGSEEARLDFSKELTNFLETEKWEIGERTLSDVFIADARVEGGIDLVRSASKFLWQKPIHSVKRTLVINYADVLTIPAQNAILKIAEEPPPSSLILLLVKHPEVLLPALRSRFQKIYIHGGKLRASESKLAKQFLKAPAAKRRDILKSIIDDDKELENFVAAIMAGLYKDKMTKWPILKELLARWTLIRQFNVNKRLQLEAALENL